MNHEPNLIICSGKWLEILYQLMIVFKTWMSNKSKFFNMFSGFHTLLVKSLEKNSENSNCYWRKFHKLIINFNVNDKSSNIFVSKVIAILRRKVQTRFNQAEIRSLSINHSSPCKEIGEWVLSVFYDKENKHLQIKTKSK